MPNAPASSKQDLSGTRTMSIVKVAVEPMGVRLEFQSSRLESLDVFRGIAIVGMLLVISPGSGEYVYGALRHAEWNGFTFADLVFPLFVFTVGIAAALSLSKRIERGEKKGKILIKIAIRTVILFTLGLMVNGLWYGLPLRVMGIFQRLALCYFFTSIIFMNIARFRALMASAAILLLSYWILMRFVPVPGYGPGVLEKNGNLAAYLDGFLLREHTYHQQTWDPEGLLGTMPAIATCLSGAFTGQWILSPRNRTKKVLGMVSMGWMGILLGLVWNIDFPINKNLWSSSYVVFTAGIMLLMFAFCYWLVDIKGWGILTKPLAILGRNALAIYLMSDATKYVLMKSSTWTRLYLGLCGLIPDPAVASLLYTIIYILVWLDVTALLYRKGITIKI